MWECNLCYSMQCIVGKQKRGPNYIILLHVYGTLTLGLGGILGKIGECEHRNYAGKNRCIF